MALKDCITKLGKAVSPEDIEQLEGYLDDGLTDTQAVRKLLISSYQNVIDITERARGEGAVVVPKPDVLGDITKLQVANLEKIREESHRLAAEGRALNDEYADIRTMEKIIQQGMPDALLTDDAQAMDALSVLLFQNKSYTALPQGMFGLKGNTPLELLASFREMQGKKDDLRDRVKEVNAQRRALDERVRTIFHGEFRNVYFQGGEPVVLHNVDARTLQLVDEGDGLNSLTVGPDAGGEIALIGVDWAEGFLGAVIPADASPDTRAVLLRNRIPYQEYQAENKAAVVSEFTKTLVETVGSTLSQRALNQPKRGSITFDENNKAIIRLTKARNLSTFLHESGHLYLEIMGDLSELPDAPIQTINDFAKILNFLGIEHRGQITREHHEKWAKSYELYLMEGKAPTPELQTIYSAFSQWLLKIYKHLRTLAGIELTDDIRRVMDRMVATDEAITEAENIQGFGPVFSTAEAMGVSPEVFEVYRANMAKAHEDAVAVENGKILAAMNREAKTWWQDERKKIEAEVTAEVHAMRVYKALAMLQRGETVDGEPTVAAPFKLDRDDLIKRYGKDFIKGLPGRGTSGIYRIKGGVSADVAANIFGYENADAMIQEIMGARPMDPLIKAETDARMQRKFPDPLVDGSLQADALVVVHNEKRAQILAAELRALRKLMREDQKIVSATRRAAAREGREGRAAGRALLPRRGELAIIKHFATRTIAALRIRNVNPNKYLVAERKAARKSFDAAGKGNFAVAYDEKLKEINAHELYRAATRAKEESLSTQKYMRRMATTKTKSKLGRSDFFDRIKTVLNGINFRGISIAQVDRETAMDEMLEAVKDGRLIVPPETMAKLRQRGTNWQDLTVQEFRDMRNLVKQLEYAAKREVDQIVNGEKIIYETARNEVVDSILAANKVVDTTVAEPLGKEHRDESLKEGIHHWRSPGSLARILDNAGWGAVTRRIIVPIRRAYVEKLLPAYLKAGEDIGAIFQKHYSHKELVKFKLRKSVPAMGQELSKSDILSIAMHWGSESNRKALLGGMIEDVDGNKTLAYPEQGVRAALATLDTRDWAFIQDIWDYYNTYWSSLSAAEKRRRGYAPEKIEAMPFEITTSDGQTILVAGGYAPLRYDPRHSDRVKVDEFKDILRRIGNGVFASANTRAGATHERKENGGKVVRLGLGQIDAHLREIIRDISIGDEINFVARLINDPKIRNALKKTGNQAALEELKLWITDAAVGELPATTAWEQIFAWTRVGFVKSKLAFSSTVGLLQLTGIFQSMAFIGSVAYGRGVGIFMKDPVGQYKRVMTQSSFMNTRYSVLQTFDMNVADTRDFLKSRFGITASTVGKFWFRVLPRYMFWHIAKLQSFVDVTTWLAAEWKGVNLMGLSQSDSKLYADSQTEAAQTGGLFPDRSALERGTLSPRIRQAQFVRVWMVLITYMARKGALATEIQSRFNKNQNKTMIDGLFLLTDYALLFTLEGIASALIYGNLPGRGSDEEIDAEDVAAWLVEVTIDSIISGVPLIREYTSARYGSGNTPIGAFMTDVFNLRVQLAQGEMDEAQLKAAVKVIGTAFHLPASQVNRLIEALLADDPKAYEYIMGVRE